MKLTSSLLVGLLCCSMAFAQSIKVKYLPESEFSQYHTYKWVKISLAGTAGTVDEAVVETVQRGVDALMHDKPFTKVDNGPSDLLLVCQIAVRQKRQWAGLDPHIPTALAVLDNPGDMTVDVGTLVLDVHDSATRKLLWHGRAKKTFDEHDTDEAVHKSTEKAIAKLMKKFPPER